MNRSDILLLMNLRVSCSGTFFLQASSWLPPPSPLSSHSTDSLSLKLPRQTPQSLQLKSQMISPSSLGSPYLFLCSTFSLQPHVFCSFIFIQMNSQIRVVLRYQITRRNSLKLEESQPCQESARRPGFCMSLLWPPSQNTTD